MLVARRLGRLFLFVLLTTLAAPAQTLPTTTINDTVYRGDGAPAGGTLLISWPQFTVSGSAVAAGSTSTSLGPGGALSVALVPNANAIPGNTVYTVVYVLTLCSMPLICIARSHSHGYCRQRTRKCALRFREKATSPRL